MDKAYGALLSVSQFAKKHAVSRQWIHQLIKKKIILVSFPVKGGPAAIDTDVYSSVPTKKSSK